MIASSDLEKHKTHLREVFQRLSNASLRLNTSKCEFGLSEIEFLGHTIDPNGLFLGCLNFYRRSLPHAAEKQRPLNSFLKNSRKNDRREIDWTSLTIEAFKKCRSSIVDTTLLTHSDCQAPTRVISDASDYGMGAALEQFQEGSWKPLAFFSRGFNSAQKNTARTTES